MPRFNAPIDLLKSELRNAVVQNLATAPTSPLPGQLYYDTTVNGVLIWNGTAWISASSPAAATNATLGTLELTGDLGGTATAPTVVNLHLAGDTAVNHKLTGLLDPTLAQDAATKNYVDTRSLSTLLAPTGDVPWASHKITGLLDPTNPQDGATKNYVDTVAQGLSPKPSAVAATTGSETYTLVSGTVTSIAGTTIDGQSPVVGNRILVLNAPFVSGGGSPGAGDANSGNGLYVVTSLAGGNIALSRDPTMAGAQNPSGAYVFVEAGSSQLSTGWVVAGNFSSFTWGTTPLYWTQFSGAGTITAGTGLAKSGNTLSIENSGVLLLTHGGTGAATAAAARANLGTGSTYTSTLTGNSATTSFSFTPSGPPVLTGAWQVTLINKTSGAIEYADVTVNQTTNAITVAFTTAPATGTSYTLLVVG